MIVKYIKTTSASLNDLPIVNGQIIALTDTDGLYYDLENTRHVAGSGTSSSTLEGLSDVNLTSLANGQTLTYDATSEEWINATIFGNETISYDDFLDLPQEEKDNGTAYYIPDAGWTGGGSGGGGGTTVVANPAGQATDDLTKLQVGTTIYAVSGGGGSTYTAGDGIVIDNDEISVDEMPDTDMAEIVTPLPGTMSRRMKYSTTEQVVGEWIDGKPVYQKVFTDTVSTGWVEKNHSIANVDNIFISEGYLQTSTGFARRLGGCANNGVYCMAQVGKEKISIYNTDSSYITLVVVLQYTKTTDQANS